MKTVNFFSVVILAIGLMSCAETEDTRPDCEKNNTGTIILRNNDPNSFTVSVDGVNNGVIQGERFLYLTVPAGTHSVRVVRQSGSHPQDIMFDPFVLAKCGEMAFTIEDTRPDCEKNNTGTIILKNTDSDPFTVYVDEINKGTIQGNQTIRLTVPAGTHSVRVVERSGWILYPQETSFAAFVLATCAEKTCAWD
ncbi:hypothetical protein Barb7_01480 [Bacteroidales bacterium Barb7]|nr:hypothetical protein Barb7_01480 [Bacteroidales bacterium Barb7]